jgi:hypothetical protein
MRKVDQAELALEYTMTTSSFDSADNTPDERHTRMYQAIDRVGQRVLSTLSKPVSIWVHADIIQPDINPRTLL